MNSSVGRLLDLFCGENRLHHLQAKRLVAFGTCVKGHPWNGNGGPEMANQSQTRSV